jgi:pyridinium-3,5-bisthiocarboxylic acid mononucleotide nickel chelatase
MRVAYLECFSGISGDMLLGALVDAGVPFELLEKAAASLKVSARIEKRTVMRGGLTGSKVDVVTEQGSGIRDQESQNGEQGPGVRNQESEHAHGHEHPRHDHEHGEHGHDHGHEVHGHHEHDHHAHEAHEHEEEHCHAHRSLSTILAIIEGATLSETVKARASRAFQLLGEAEAVIHSIPIEQVHFHEVGAVDTIVDIVCTAAGCEALGVDKWMASPLNVGSGTVKCAHGTLPVPAPATLALVGDAPVYSAGPPMERVTPTGAALLRMLDVTYGPLPSMRVEARGYGAGGRDTPGEPNLLRLLVGEETTPAGAGPARYALDSTEPIAVMETVIDDSNPQLVAYVSELLLEAGAWDVYRTAVQMKKGRTGMQVTVLSSPERVPALREILFRETTTIGMHWRIENKIALDREFADVETEWGRVRMKIARLATGEVVNVSPEFEHCRAIARQHRVPLKRVMQAAMSAWATGQPRIERVSD